MGRKVDAQLLRTEERLSQVLNVGIKLADRVTAIEEAYKKDMATIRDVLTNIIEGR